MFTHSKQRRQQGFTYVELIIVTAIMVLVFGAIMVSFQYALQVGYNTRVKLSALSLANDRMELFRSLPYDDVALTSDFPPGAIPQNSTFELNGFTINERVFIDQYDDPADGLGLSAFGGTDSNDIITDYRRIKVEYSWTLDGATQQLSLMSNIVPRSIESDLGGGTIRINVLDADNTPLSGATVRVLGSSSTAPYDRTVSSGLSGDTLFTVAADSGYQVFVTGNIAGRRYSTSSTYVATPSNPIPVVAPISVTQAGISTLTFKIGELSSLLIKANSLISEDSVEESFDNSAGIATSTDTTTSAGQLQLQDSLGMYETTGITYLNQISPVSILSWQTVRIAAEVPSDTNYQVQFFTGTTTSYVLIPDADLPGNAVGFTDTLIDISNLDPTLYPAITIGISLETTDTTVTPSVQEVEVFWREAETPISGETLQLQGVKTIGSTATSAPIYKTVESVVTNSSGEVAIPDLEFDTYTVTPASSYSVAMVCPEHPFSLGAGVSADLEFLYVPQETTNLRVVVRDSLGRSVPGVDVRLRRAGYDVAQATNSCGQTYFANGGLTDETDYELTISAPGYATKIINSFAVSGETVSDVILAP